MATPLNKIIVPIAEIDNLLFTILNYVTKPRGLLNKQNINFFDACCIDCGSTLPGNDLMQLASRITLRNIDATVVNLAGEDVPVCPKCGCPTVEVTLCGMTKEELALVRSNL